MCPGSGPLYGKGKGLTFRQTRKSKKVHVRQPKELGRKAVTFLEDGGDNFSLNRGCNAAMQ